MENVIDEEVQTRHSALSKKIEDLLESPIDRRILAMKLKLNLDYVDFCYSPIVQSGGTYDFKVNAEVNNEILQSDTIVCSYGGEYKYYKTNIVRTLLINPDEG